MAFIKSNNQFKIGTKIRLSKNIESMSGTLLKGSVVTITGKTPHGYNIEDSKGHRMYECGWDIGTKITHDGTPSEYLAYITAYLLVTFENGMVATAHVNCDMADPAGTQAFLDEFYQTAWQMYDKPNMSIKDVKYIGKEMYDKIAKMEGPNEILYSESWKDDKIMIRTSEPINGLDTTDDATDWIITVSSSEADGSVLNRFHGTKDEVKALLINMINNDKDNDEDNFDYSTETVDEIEDDGKVLNAYAVYSNYHIDYTAMSLDNIASPTSDISKGGN